MQTAYIVRRSDAYAVQKTELHPSGTEHEVFWREGLTLAEADAIAANCHIERRD
jgi:hypothetical protein